MRYKQICIWITSAVTLLLIVMASPATRAADCDPGPVISKYAEDENMYKYRKRDRLAEDIATLVADCDIENGGDIGQDATLQLVLLAYEYGVFAEVQPLAALLPGMETKSVEDAMFAHAEYTGNAEYIFNLMRQTMKYIRQNESSYRKFKNSGKGMRIDKYLNGINNYEEGIALLRRDLGWLLMNYGDYDAAITEYEIVMEDQPSFWITPAQLGTRYLETGELDRAAFFSKYSLARDDAVRPYVNLAQIALLEGRPDEAERYAAKIEDISEGYMSLVFGLIDMGEGEYREASNNFKRYFDTEPVITRHWNHEPLFAAVKLLGRLLEESSGDKLPDEDTLAGTAAELEGEGALEDAAAHYYLLTLMYPQNPDYYYSLGRCYELLGLHYSAVRGYSLHMRLAPDSPHADDIRAYFDSRMIDYSELEK